MDNHSGQNKTLKRRPKASKKEKLRKETTLRENGVAQLTTLWASVIWINSSSLMQISSSDSSCNME